MIKVIFENYCEDVLELGTFDDLMNTLLVDSPSGPARRILERHVRWFCHGVLDSDMGRRVTKGGDGGGDKKKDYGGRWGRNGSGRG